MQRGQSCEVTAIASRSLAAAQEAAEQLGSPKVYGSYEALLAEAEKELGTVASSGHCLHWRGLELDDEVVRQYQYPGTTWFE